MDVDVDEKELRVGPFHETVKGGGFTFGQVHAQCTTNTTLIPLLPITVKLPRVHHHYLPHRHPTTTAFLTAPPPPPKVAEIIRAQAPLGCCDYADVQWLGVRPVPLIVAEFS
jgi:hypothetical protein